MRQLVVNADDFGFTRDVNAGIVRAHREGILTATTLMANGDAFADAVRLAEENPMLDIGCHLQMVQGESIAEPGRALPPTVGQLILQLSLGRWDVRAELRAQVEKILAAGIAPSHLDTHKHTHLLGPVLDAVASLSQEYRIPWVRRPFDLPISSRFDSAQLQATVWAMRTRAGRFGEILGRHGARSTDHFSGFVLTGRFEARDLLDLFPKLPAGSTEFMCHPGELGAELASAPTRLKRERVRELEALTDPRVRETLVREGIQLCRYVDLSAS